MRIQTPGRARAAWAALLCLLLVACGEGKKAASRSIDTQAAGYQIYQKAICHRCHGLQLEGSPKAPGLLELNQYYDAARLVQYLIEPDSMQASDARLKSIDERYTSFEMPSYAMLDSTTRARLVEFLLSPWTRP